MIADDSPSIRQVVRSHFEQNSDWYVCGEADDGDTAVELVRQLKPNGVVLDFSMPRMNGLDAAQQIAKISPNTRVVLFTAHDSRILRVHAAEQALKLSLPRMETPVSMRFNTHCETTSHVRNKS